MTKPFPLCDISRQPGDFPFRMTLYLDRAFSVNYMKCPRPGNQKGITITSKYRDWKRKAERDILLQDPVPFNVGRDHPYFLETLFTGKGSFGDVDNYIKCIHDVLEDAKILNNDKFCTGGKYGIEENLPFPTKIVLHGHINLSRYEAWKRRHKI